jgi:hypothetical protein
LLELYACNYSNNLRVRGSDYDLTAKEIESFKVVAQDLLQLATDLRLKFSYIKAMDLDMLSCIPGCPASDALATVREVNKTLTEELAATHFLFIPSHRIPYYNKPSPFGESTTKAFPHAEYDIQEASQCFALGRFTACVYHSMRVLEHGLCALAKKFEIPFGHKTWADIILPIEKEIRQIALLPNKTPNKKKNEQFYAEAAAQFMHFKDGWRNYTAHKQFIYDEEKAEAIFRHVRDFMSHISTRLKQGKKP